MATKPLTTDQKLYLKARTAYYDGAEIMTDQEFNALEDKLKLQFPKWKELKRTGGGKKVETPLEQYMPSLNKMYPEDVPKFNKRPANKKVLSWIEMDKLDGTSLQLVYFNRVPTRLITRGDGTTGQDVSFFIPHLVKIGKLPARIPTNERKVFRLEGVMGMKVFAKKWAQYFDNPRQALNGMFNRQDMHPALKDVDLVVLGVYGLSLVNGLKASAEWGFDVVRYEVYKSGYDLSAEGHTKRLEDSRKTSLYEIDGRVRAPAQWVLDYPTADKPKAMIAFKLNDEANAEQVPVLDILWKKTRLNRWSCRVKIPPTKMDGVVVEHATGHNPAWMKERGIGPGAIIKILRSGKVIPKIIGVVKKAKFKNPPGAYEQKGRFFYGVDDDSGVSDIRAIHHFLVTMGIEGMAEKSVAKAYEGGLTSAGHYVMLAVQARKRDAAAAAALQRAGIGRAVSMKVIHQLRDVFGSPVLLKKLMVSSSCFESIGARKLSMVESAGVSMSQLLTMKWTGGGTTKLEGKLYDADGVGPATVEALYQGVKGFKSWAEPFIASIAVDGSIPKAKRSVKGPLTGLKVAFTSYRSEEQEKIITSMGGEIVSYGAKMDVLLWKAGAKFMDKINAVGSKAMHWEQFCKKYGVKA